MDLTPLLRPRSIAVVGANERADAYAANVLRNLERSGFEGPVWGVNPRRTEALGRPCVPTVAELPEPVDAVVVAIPAAGVPAAVAEAAARGCGGAVVLSAGFGEIAAGRELERRLRETAREGDLPVCGPNGNGIVATATRAAMWGDSAPPLEPGPVAMVSQSGNVAVNALGSQRGIGWHTVVSTGNQTVCDASDWLAAICEQDGVGSVALFLESDGDGAKLAEALARCAAAGVGVAVLKVGASEAGARAASAHTGALAGDQRVFRALVEEAGGAWARGPHELLELAKALAEPRARPRRPVEGGRPAADPPHGTSPPGGLCVLTCSGGDSGIAADEAQEVGLELPPLQPETRERLDGLLPEAATIANPLDYTAMIWGDTELLRRIVATVGADPGIDQLLMLYDHPRDLSPESEASWAAVRAGILAGAAEVEAAALVASTLPDLIEDDACRELAAHGVPAIAGLRTALRCALALRAQPGDPERLREISGLARALRAGGEPVRGPAGDWLGEAEAKAMLAEAGIAVPPGRVVDGEEECVREALELGLPVALKLSSAELRHKSEYDALELDLGSEGEVRAAHRRLVASPAAEGARVLVERMAEAGAELLVAARADGVVPALVVGLGGIWTEALDDVAIVPLPADRARVERAISGLRGATMLHGGRGTEPLDIAAAAALAARAGELLVERDLDLLELNPVVVHRRGCVALDAAARLTAAGSARAREAALAPAAGGR
jgi:acetate---CoA ligase (ADP-forming)